MSKFKNFKDFMLRWTIRGAALLLACAMVSCQSYLSPTLFGHGSSSAFELGMAMWMIGLGIIGWGLYQIWEITKK